MEIRLLFRWFDKASEEIKVLQEVKCSFRLQLIYNMFAFKSQHKRPFLHLIWKNILRFFLLLRWVIYCLFLSFSLHLINSVAPAEPLLCKFADGGQKKRQSQVKYPQNGRPWTREGEVSWSLLKNHKKAY